MEETLKKAIEVSGENSAFVKLLKQQIKEEKEKLDEESSAADEKSCEAIISDFCALKNKLSGFET